MNRAAPTEPTLAQRLRGIAVDSIKQWVDDRAASKGAALAYYTLFSLAPVLIIVLAIAGVVFGEDAARGAIFHELRGLVGQDGAQAIQLLLAPIVITLFAILFLPEPAGKTLEEMA